jgi:hypothetical protein
VGDTLRNAALEKAEIVATEAAQVRAIGRKNVAVHFYQSDLGADRPRRRSFRPPWHNRFRRNPVELARSGVAAKFHVAIQAPWPRQPGSLPGKCYRRCRQK